MKFELTKEYLKKIQNLIKEKNKFQIDVELKLIHPADIAEIYHKLDFDEAYYIHQIFEDELAADILVELEDDLREQLIEKLSPKEIVEEIIENLDSDDAADIVLELPNEVKEKVISRIEKTKFGNDITDLLNYPENTAGGLMAKELIKVNENWSVMRCVREMRKQAENVNFVYTIYVVNNDDYLLGTLSLKQLLLTDSKTLISNIFRKDIIKVNAKENNEEVANIMNKYDLIVLPVVNDEGKLIGRITGDDVMEVIKEEAEKDYQMASGISEDVESRDNIITITRARLPWLLIGMIGGILGAKLIGFFDIEKNYEMAFFIPLIAAMGGNVGVQSAAIVVQGLAGGTISLNSTFNRLIKELGVALLNGIICSIIIYFSTYFLGYNFLLSVTVSLALLAVIVFAALFGAFVPLTLKKYKIDPALATGPFITTINDILGLFIYFVIGQMILN